MKGRVKYRLAGTRWTRLAGTFVLGGTVALIALPASTSLADPGNFQAQVHGTVGDRICDNTGCYRVATATGHANDLGDVTVDYKIYAEPGTPCVALHGTRTFTTPDGTVSMNVQGAGCPTGNSPNGLDVDYNWVVTGGTGKFSNATGSGTEKLQTNKTFPDFVEHYAGTLSF